MDVMELRERIARALWDQAQSKPPSARLVRSWDEAPYPSREAMLAYADAVIAALGLGPAVERFGAQESDGTVYGWEPDAETVRREWPGMPVVCCRYYLTPWEPIEENG